VWVINGSQSGIPEAMRISFTELRRLDDYRGDRYARRHRLRRAAQLSTRHVEGPLGATLLHIEEIA
jgi:hypothetical protein